MVLGILAWSVTVFAALPYPLLAWSYRRVLNHKRMEMEAVLGGTSDLYRRAFGGNSVNRLFELHYSGRAYILPVAFSMIVVMLMCVLSLSRVKLFPGIPMEVGQALAEIPNSVIAGAAGAYLWGLYDVLSRYRLIDLSPVSLHFVWLRLLIATVLGSLAGQLFQESLASLGAFVLGTFPVRTLSRFLKEQGKSRLQLSQPADTTEKPGFDKIEGLTPDLIDRLADSGIETAETLAYADPLKLLLLTNFEWKVIIDLIDQAYLYVYIGDKIVDLRPLGIRGAIELVEIGDCLRDAATVDLGRQMVAAIASKVHPNGDAAKNEAAVINLIRTLDLDPQVTLISTLWGEWSPVENEAAPDAEGQE